MDESRDLGRLWRRAIGMGAFVLFLGGLLVAVDLEELVVIVATLGALCALAGGVTLLLARYRTALLHGLATAGRVTAPQVVRASRRAGTGGRRLAGASGRTGRSAGLALAAGGAETARATRTAAERTMPVLRRADERLGVRVRTVAIAGRRHAARALAVIAADIHAHREAIRSSSPRAGEPVRPPARRTPVERRSPATRPARAQQRDRG